MDSGLPTWKWKCVMAQSASSWSVVYRRNFSFSFVENDLTHESKIDFEGNGCQLLSCGGVAIFGLMDQSTKTEVHFELFRGRSLLARGTSTDPDVVLSQPFGGGLVAVFSVVFGEEQRPVLEVGTTFRCVVQCAEGFLSSIAEPIATILTVPPSIHQRFMSESIYRCVNCLFENRCRKTYSEHVAGCSTMMPPPVSKRELHVVPRTDLMKILEHNDILSCIFSFFKLRELLKMRIVCKSWADFLSRHVIPNQFSQLILPPVSDFVTTQCKATSPAGVANRSLAESLNRFLPFMRSLRSLNLMQTDLTGSSLQHSLPLLTNLTSLAIRRVYSDHLPPSLTSLDACVLSISASESDSVFRLQRLFADQIISSSPNWRFPRLRQLRCR